MPRDILTNIFNSFSKHKFFLVFSPINTENVYIWFVGKICNAVRNYGNEPLDVLVDSERADAIQTQMPQVATCKGLVL